jgi:hypothetical protein
MNKEKEKIEEIEDDELFEIISLDDLLADELNDLAAETEILKALYDDDF